MLATYGDRPLGPPQVLGTEDPADAALRHDVAAHLDAQLQMRPSDAPSEQYAPLVSFLSPGGLLEAPFKVWYSARGLELNGGGASSVAG